MTVTGAPPWSGALLTCSAIPTQLTFAMFRALLPATNAFHVVNAKPNVCEEQQLTVVGLPRPCVRAFTHTVKLWNQGCAGPRWCVGYERRTRYYTVYRQAYSMERQTVYRCCPGWRQQDDEPGCLRSVSAVATCFHGRRCSDSEAQQCRCSEGFQGPHCQYELLSTEVFKVLSEIEVAKLHMLQFWVGENETEFLDWNPDSLSAGIEE
ncbi:hypothetical protein QTO34_014724 [Cnephaeus nilssonii]|uniref:Uncharacterized protein n=1 Tax=Cnephaeus nilssonii TaxID=3371016 RepID=A0AA40LUB0_CNENI|nr:hypothetical protein QTO34_014724 [Eptesicus nilssonii]